MIKEGPLRMKINFKKLHPDARGPVRSDYGDAGYDLSCLYRTVIPPMARVQIPTGLAVEIPHGYYGRIAPRSGLAVKHGLDVLGGVIDSGYRGEISVVLINLNLPEELSEAAYKRSAIHSYESHFGSRSTAEFSSQSRIAQLIIEKCHDVEWGEVAELAESVRGAGGFGSSGV